MRYFIFQDSSLKVIGKACSNCQPMIDKWLADPNAEEVTEKIYNIIRVNEE